jgi:hypothetical protein
MDMHMTKDTEMEKLDMDNIPNKKRQNTKDKNKNRFHPTKRL